MRDDRGFKKVLEVLDARVQKLEALLAKEQRLRADLRERQLEIVSQEHEVAVSIHETSAEDPSAFRYHDLRLRKLVEEQRRLQPTLAKAAMQREAVKDALKTVLKQRMGVALQLEKLSEDASAFQSEDERAAVLFELSKRQNAS
jgi:CBS-domain-containing membrane protein